MEDMLSVLRESQFLDEDYARSISFRFCSSNGVIPL